MPTCNPPPLLYAGVRRLYPLCRTPPIWICSTVTSYSHLNMLHFMHLIPSLESCYVCMCCMVYLLEKLPSATKPSNFEKENEEWKWKNEKVRPKMKKRQQNKTCLNTASVFIKRDRSHCTDLLLTSSLFCTITRWLVVAMFFYFSLSWANCDKDWQRRFRLG